MTTVGFKESGNMIAEFAQFDLEAEVRDSQQHKPWQSGLYSKTLVKKEDLRAVLIAMERGPSSRSTMPTGGTT